MNEVNVQFLDLRGKVVEVVEKALDLMVRSGVSNTGYDTMCGINNLTSKIY